MKKLFWVMTAVFFAAGEVPAHATVNFAKTYKKAYGLDKAPRCIGCHVQEKPKKDSNHELNDYGKKVIALSPESDEKAFKEAGPIPEAE